MKRTPVKSTQLASVGWQPNHGLAFVGTLEVEFVKGSVYRYADVPPSVMQELLAESARVEALAEVPSVGRLFDRLVKKAGYAYEKVS